MSTSSQKPVQAKKAGTTARKSPLRGKAVKVLSAEELHQNMKSFGKTLADNPKAATTFLQDAGILTPSGKLAKAYRG